jgi:hypothetical protein
MLSTRGDFWAMVIQVTCVCLSDGWLKCVEWRRGFDYPRVCV